MTGILARLRQAREKLPAAAAWTLLGLESLLTALPFIVSWMVCAVILSVQVGYLMAKSDAEQKAAILQKLWAKKSLKP